MVYYRKYRPQTISELDLGSVREKLTAILSTKDIPHAFLFTGSRGLGKTSSARILAKAINCKSKKGIEPCNKCDTCISITNGSHIDIIEIDGASNRGVDEIRSLRERVKFSPSELSKKVYIIDEVHMLTTEAFNALLKTLEEPPDHVMFILATTEAHKIPQTILSRAFSVKFERPTTDEIVNSLKRIADGEKLSVEEEVFEKAAELSEGSFRDAAKILEELSLNSKGKINLELVNRVYKAGSIEKQSEKLLEQIYKKDMKESLKTISDIASEGVDFRMVIERIVEKLRQDLLKGKGKISEQKEILRLLNEAYQGIKLSVLPQLPLELAVMEWAIKPESGIKNQELRDGKLIIENRKKAEEKQIDDKAQEVEREEQVRTAKIKSQGDNFLKDLIDSVHKESRQVAAFLRSCKDAKVNGSTLNLTTPYSLHAEKLSKKEFADLIIKNARELNKNINELKVDLSE